MACETFHTVLFLVYIAVPKFTFHVNGCYFLLFIQGAFAGMKVKQVIFSWVYVKKR